MPEFFTHWWVWLVGGGTLTFIVVSVLLYVLAPKAFEVAAEFLKPIAGAFGRVFAVAVDGTTANVKEGAPYIARNPKAIFCVALLCVVVAALVYFPTKQVAAKKAEAKTWAYAHKHWSMKARPKPKSVAQNTLDTLRKSLGGITP